MAGDYVLFAACSVSGSSATVPRTIKKSISSATLCRQFELERHGEIAGSTVQGCLCLIVY